MKKTRRAAAVWMTMSLALSTIFGNTAWGEVLQETGGNRCTHVHTAECYGDLDETATPSQIGELEPAKCTHVCSEETGCIQNIKNEGGLSTPSNADDSTVNPGTSTADDSTVKPGTTTRVDTQTKTKNEIHSWTWYDPEEILIGGKLELTGVTEEAQPSFEEVTEYLPQAIIAQVGERDVWEEKNLQIANWTCAEYVQDEKGCWPLEGNYEFTAELPDGYELADGVDALVVEVSVAGDQTAMASTPIRILSVYGANGGKQEDLNWDGENYSGGLSTDSALWNKSVEVVHNGDDSFKLQLTNANLGNIYINDKNWTIVLSGDNNLDGTGNGAGGIGIYVYGGGRATITAVDDSASLTVSGHPKKNINDGSCGIEVGTSLTIERGIVNASVSRLEQHNDASGAIYVTRGGCLNITGGSVNATGNYRWALAALGTINMSGGTFEIVGNGKVAVDHEPGSNFTISDGTINVISPTGNTGIITKGNLTINGGRMKANILEIAAGNTMKVNRGTLETGGIKIGDKGKLINKGTLIANGNFEGNGVIENFGTISGTGNVPEGNRTDPGAITFSDPDIVQYDGSSVNFKTHAHIQKPENAGDLTYEILNESTGEGSIDTNGILTVKKVGTFVIQVTTKGTGIYRPANPVKITLKVTPGKFPDEWKLKVEAASGVYNGAEGYPAATITATNIPNDAKYEYQLAATSNSNNLPDQWQSECPKIVNVSESGKYVFVKVTTDNYESKVFCSNSTTNIINRSFTNSVAVTIDSSVYNNKLQNPKIKALENWKGVLGSELTEGVDYVIDHWENDNGQAVKKLEDAGTYTAYLLGMGNYDGSLKTATFTIEKCKLKSQMTGGPLVKVYDGTTNITEEQNVFVQLYGDSGIPDLQDIRADRVEYAYQSADVGEHYIDATIITLAGNKLDNYEVIKWKSSLLGTITPRDFKSMTVSAVPLTYDGTEQKPQINASVDTGLDKVSSSNAEFSYSMDGENFDSEVPSFKDPGTYTVYVKAEMDNFNPKTDKVEVIVQKAATPTAAGLSETYSYKETGEKRVKFTGIPEDCGMLAAVTAQIVSDEGQIIDGSPTVDGSEVVFKLKGSSREMIGKTAQIVVTVETQNYENIEIPVAVTLKADPSDSDSENGSSSSDDSDYNDSKTTAPKLSDVRSGNAANSAANNVTKDSKKGYWSNARGIITGADNQVTNDGYSHWMKDSKGWWLRYSDGSYPKGSAGEYHWEKINGRWWAFGADGYLSTGWIYDTFYQGWFYMDANQGMLTGWQFIDGKWYYLNPVSDGTCGIMYAKKRTPDGWLVKEDGSWDEEAGR